MCFWDARPISGHMINSFSSRLPKFFELSVAERRELLCLKIDIGQEFLVADGGLNLELADNMSENVVATFSLPMAIAANFVVDSMPVLVPMVTEEPSIVAAASKMAKLVSLSGGFFTKVDSALQKGQIQLYGLRDIDHAKAIFLENKDSLLKYANDLCPSMVKRLGGVVDIEMRVISSKIGPMLLIEPLMDVVDAMGANAINTLLESLSEKIADIFGGTIGLRILSNLCDKRMAHAYCEIPIKNLATDEACDNGLDVALKIIAAHAFAEADIYRAVTHNKGIMNGIDAVALATGNDFRALEAGAHAFASVGGYGPLTKMSIDGPFLRAEISLPMAVGVVGGVTNFHPSVKLAHKILGAHAKSAKKLSAVMASVGLAQCLAALFALSQDGIQKGHMKLHRKKGKS